MCKSKAAAAVSMPSQLRREPPEEQGEPLAGEQASHQGGMRRGGKFVGRCWRQQLPQQCPVEPFVCSLPDECANPRHCFVVQPCPQGALCTVALYAWLI